MDARFITHLIIGVATILGILGVIADFVFYGGLTAACCQ